MVNAIVPSRGNVCNKTASFGFDFCGKRWKCTTRELVALIQAQIGQLLPFGPEAPDVLERKLHRNELSDKIVSD